MERCWGCRFYDGDRERGECLRSAPTPVAGRPHIVSVHPEVEADGWCGDYAEVTVARRAPTDLEIAYTRKLGSRAGARDEDIEEAVAELFVPLNEQHLDDNAWRLDHPKRRFRVRVWRVEDGPARDSEGLIVTLVRFAPSGVSLAAVGVSIDGPENPTPGRVTHDDAIVAEWITRTRRASA